MPKPKVALYGLTTEAYKLAGVLVDKAEVTIIDETLQMAMDLNAGFLKKNPDLDELMNQEPLLSFKPLEQVLGGAEVIFFTPRLRRPSDESLIEASSKMRDLARHLPRNSNLINSLPTGPGGNSENIMLLEKQTGLRVGDSLVYSYMPLRLDEPGSSVVANAGAKERPMLEVLGFPQNSQNVFSAELEYSSKVLEEAMMSVTEIELSRKAREARVVVHSDKDVYMSEFSRHLHDLRAIQASDEAGESISYLAGATLKSLENYVRYLVDETREILKERELKASRTKISLVWDLDRYEMRGDRLQLAESIQQRLRDYVTDVEIVSSSKVKGGGEVLDPLKHNVVIACSRADYESLKHLRKGHGEGDVTVIKATPALSRE